VQHDAHSPDCHNHGRNSHHGGTAGAPPHPSLRKPVTIIGGFLGAGKTTLLNHVVNHRQGMRMEVIIREYGAVGVDDRLVEDRTTHVHLVSGASLHNDPQLHIFWAMENLYSRCDRLGTGSFTWQDVDFDYLLMETSGLDNPEWLVTMFFLEQLRDHYRLDGYVVLVDAEYGELNLDEYRIAREQLAFADVILVNKIDMVEEEKLSNLERRLRGINSVAAIHRTEYARVDLGKVLNAGRFERVPSLSALREISGAADKRRAREEVSVDGIKTVVLSEKHPMDKDRANEWIKDLLVTRGHRILRSKGFLDFAGSDYRFVFQGVRKTFHSKADRLWEPGDERGSVIVLIGEGLEDEADLQEAFSACVAQPLVTPE